MVLQVYLTLCSALAFSALGAYLHIILNIGGTLTTVGCLAAVAFLISLPPSQDQERNRFALLMSAALLEGASVGPIVDLVLRFDPRSGPVRSGRLAFRRQLDFRR